MEGAEAVPIDGCVVER